jgi:thiamine biosynthesis lipoprotein
MDEEKNEVFLKHPGMEIDLGGFGKGYALEKVKMLLEKHAVNNAVISFGDSSILAIGNHPYGDCWKVGIRHLLDTGKSAYTFDLKNEALSSSGMPDQHLNSERNGCHIINPETGKYREAIKTVSVCSGSPLDSEVLSTAITAADSIKRKKIFNNFPGCRAVEINYSENSGEDVKRLN